MANLRDLFDSAKTANFGAQGPGAEPEYLMNLAPWQRAAINAINDKAMTFGQTANAKVNNLVGRYNDLMLQGGQTPNLRDLLR